MPPPRLSQESAGPPHPLCCPHVAVLDERVADPVDPYDDAEMGSGTEWEAGRQDPHPGHGCSFVRPGQAGQSSSPA